jgi:hypothetical protein
MKTYTTSRTRRDEWRAVTINAGNTSGKANDFTSGTYLKRQGAPVETKMILKSHRK